MDVQYFFKRIFSTYTAFQGRDPSQSYINKTGGCQNLRLFYFQRVNTECLSGTICCPHFISGGISYVKLISINVDVM